MSAKSKNHGMDSKSSGELEVWVSRYNVWFATIGHQNKFGANASDGWKSSKDWSTGGYNSGGGQQDSKRFAFHEINEGSRDKYQSKQSNKNYHN